MGQLVSHEGWILVSDRTPLKSRWGGWYVTGMHGSQVHLGNIVIKTIYDFDKLDELREIVEADSAAVKSLMQILQEASQRSERELKRLREADEMQPRFLVMIECDDEAQQRELLARFHDEGLKCEAKVA